MQITIRTNQINLIQLNNITAITASGWSCIMFRPPKNTFQRRARLVKRWYALNSVRAWKRPIISPGLLQLKSCDVIQYNIKSRRLPVVIINYKEIHSTFLLKNNNWILKKFIVIFVYPFWWPSILVSSGAHCIPM